MRVSTFLRLLARASSLHFVETGAIAVEVEVYGEDIDVILDEAMRLGCVSREALNI
jgi:hypothetical protein